MRRDLKMTALIQDRYHMTEENVKKSIRESVPNKLIDVTVKGKIDDVTVICDPNFMHELLAYYHWGERNAQNYLEDTFRISGQVFYDENKMILVPRFLLRMVSEDRTKTGVITNVVNKQGAEYQNYILGRSLDDTDYQWLKSFGPLGVIGHGHSHPDLGSIGVFPSSIDVEDHTRNIADDNHSIWLSHIVDPIRGLSGFYFGPNMKCPKVVYMFYPSDYDLFVLHDVFKRIAPETIPEHIHKDLLNVDEHKVPVDEGDELNHIELLPNDLDSKDSAPTDDPNIINCDNEDQNTELLYEEIVEKIGLKERIRRKIHRLIRPAKKN